MNSYRVPLVGFVLPLVNGDVQVAEDVVQETLLRGWQHARELNPESAGSWLHTVAHNIAISTYHRRRRARPREIPLDENALPTIDDVFRDLHVTIDEREHKSHQRHAVGVHPGVRAAVTT